MSFQTPYSIREVLNEIIDNKYYLPSIQREFVWKKEQIELLFDSLMRGYPIGSFLFWQVQAATSKKFRFYKFLQSYHEKKQRHNEPATLTGERDIVSILDGQQRLTALLIGLQGTYADKLPGKWITNDKSYPERTLCLEVLKEIEDEDIDRKFNFKFLRKEEIIQTEEEFWVPLPNFFNQVKTAAEAFKYILLDPQLNAAKNDFTMNTLNKLGYIINDDKIISYFQEKDQNLDRVLNIFIRTNSGGTKLSYSDLLLSIATAMWKEIDARETIIEFVEELNSIGDGFDFDKDFVLKSALVLSDIGDIKFKVDNFNAENMGLIEKLWDPITRAIKLAVELVSDFGFNGKRLTSVNSIIPIAYYLMKIDAPNNYCTQNSYKDDRNTIKKWLARVLLRGVFGSMSDTTQSACRGIIKESDLSKGFPAKGIAERLFRLKRPIEFGDEEIKELLNLEYGDKQTFLVLSILYPQLNYRANHFHMDHIYPRSKLTLKSLKKAGISDDDASLITESRDRLGNLQMLEGQENQSKKDVDVDVWITGQYKTDTANALFRQTNHIPIDASLQYGDFLTFMEKREALLYHALKDYLSEGASLSLNQNAA
ncbi:MAG: DUF262 domain-containing protein [Alphaproteobacteria bacterium]|nr:DUF262 domain-containing protein [Alphaproteobacteria bacterium]